uniref:Uncharacterized protein n=1 Tax=Romanomermis culicivorax TaxID=13658 RepID=A0A915HV79_ROMCU
MTSSSIFRLVAGLQGRFNDLFFRPIFPTNDETSGIAGLVIFFPGDCQTYESEMSKHPENKVYAKSWCFERTAELLARKFPADHVTIVKPSKMSRGTFACFENFVAMEDDTYGIPRHSDNYQAWTHLQLLIENLYKNLHINFACLSGVKLIGFSKGCVVLNQLLFELPHFVQKSPDSAQFSAKISDFYFLDGGHNGGRNAWITDKSLLECCFGEVFSDKRVKVHVHMTPYQLQDRRRPYINREEKIFSTILKEVLGKRFERNVHFENEYGDIDLHFRILEEFQP